MTKEWLRTVWQSTQKVTVLAGGNERVGKVGWEEKVRDHCSCGKFSDLGNLYNSRVLRKQRLEQIFNPSSQLMYHIHKILGMKHHDLFILIHCLSLPWLRMQWYISSLRPKVILFVQSSSLTSGAKSGKMSTFGPCVARYFYTEQVILRNPIINLSFNLNKLCSLKVNNNIVNAQIPFFTLLSSWMNLFMFIGQ